MAHEDERTKAEEPYLHGNPWIIILALSAMPILILVGSLGGWFFGAIIAILGGLTAVPAQIFAIRAFKKTQWTILSAIPAMFLGAIHVGFTFTLVSVLIKAIYVRYFGP